MAFKIGSRNRQTNRPHGEFIVASQTLHRETVLFKNVTGDSNSLDSSVFLEHLNSSNWKKTPVRNADPYTIQFVGTFENDSVDVNPYGTSDPRGYLGNTDDDIFNNYTLWEEAEHYDPENFTISDNLNGFITPNKISWHANTIYELHNDGRGAQWGIPLFHHPFYYTTGRSNLTFSKDKSQGMQHQMMKNRLTALKQVPFDPTDPVYGEYADSAYFTKSRETMGFTDFRPSSLLEPDQWHGRALPDKNNGSLRAAYIFDPEENTSIQYFQLMTGPAFEYMDEFDGVSIDTLNTYNDAFNNIRTKIDGVKNSDIANTKSYGKVIGYVLEPGRMIRADSDQYPNWQHSDNYGKGKWAGRTVPNLTFSDSDQLRGYGSIRSMAYRQGAKIKPNEGGGPYGEGARQGGDFIYNPNDPKSNPYVGMTMGSPCMLTYFGKQLNYSEILSFSDDYRAPKVNVLGPRAERLNSGLDDHEGFDGRDFSPDSSSKLGLDTALSNYGGYEGRDGWVYQNAIDSSAVVWSGGKGNAPLQQNVFGTSSNGFNNSVHSHHYPYNIADYCPSRTLYNRKDENLLVSPNNHIFWVRDWFGNELSYIDKAFIEPTTISMNDWKDSIPSSNTKDVLVINNFDSDLIVCNMVKDWECWRR